MTQQVINTGAVANDGTGESLRNAFDAVNNNFANIWTAGPVDSQVVISNNRISTTVQNLALVLAGNGVGTITVDSTVVPGIDSVYDLGTANSRFNSIYSRYLYGNGAFLTGISNGSGSATSVTFSATPPSPANIGDIWIQSTTGIQYLYFNDNTSNQWAEMEAYQSFSSGGTGNGNVDLTDVSSDIIPSNNNSYSLGNSVRQWKDLWVSNSTIYLNSLPLTADGANLKVNGNTVLTTSSPLSFSNLSVTGNVTANAVYTNNYFYANGAPFPQGSNSLPGTTISIKDNAISTTVQNQDLVLRANGIGAIQVNNNITPDQNQVRDIGSSTNKFDSVYAGYFYGNGAALTGINAGNSSSIISGSSNVKILSAGGNVTIGIGGIGNVVVVASTGVNVTGTVSASGNITASYFIGNGSLLSGITTVAATTAQTVTANAQANITSVGTLTSLLVAGNIQSGNLRTNGLISATGNITGGNVSTGNITAGNVNTTGNVSGAYVLGDGSQLTNLPAGNYSNANVAAYLPTYTGNLASLTGPVTTTSNVTGGNLRTSGLISATGNITGGNVATGDITAGNVSTFGNIAGTYFIGNGAFLTGISGGNSNYSNTNVAAYLPTYTGNLSSLTGPVTTTGNIKGGNLLVGSNVAMLSNVARQVYVSNLAPAYGQGAVGDIWYQTI